MVWVAARPILIKRGDGYARLTHGEPVPEAEHWPNRSSLERHGRIKWQADEPQASRTPTPPLPPAPELKPVILPVPEPAIASAIAPAIATEPESEPEPVTQPDLPKCVPSASPLPEPPPGPAPEEGHKLGTRELRRKTRRELVDLANCFGIMTGTLKRDEIIRLIRQAQGLEPGEAP